jgi:hypothetical protein
LQALADDESEKARVGVGRTACADPPEKVKSPRVSDAVATMLNIEFRKVFSNALGGSAPVRASAQ